jgi:large subunit ribosomal protein L22
MSVSAKLKGIRVTPRKVGLLADEVRGKKVQEALTYLQHSPRKRTASLLFQLLKSAVANADQKGTFDIDQLYVKTILVGAGPILKRFRPRAKGSAYRINKRTSQVTVTLDERA